MKNENTRDSAMILACLRFWQRNHPQDVSWCAQMAPGWMEADIATNAGQFDGPMSFAEIDDLAARLTRPIRPSIMAIAYQAEAHLSAPEKERTNADRAEEGRILADLLGAMTGLDGDDERVIAAEDAITQLLHFLCHMGIETDLALESAAFQFDCEIAEESE